MPQDREVYFDKKGRKINEFSIIKIFHFIGARRKRHFMYKWVRKENGVWVGIHLTDARLSSFWLKACANKDGILENAEIVQDYSER